MTGIVMAFMVGVVCGAVVAVGVMMINELISIRFVEDLEGERTDRERRLLDLLRRARRFVKGDVYMLTMIDRALEEESGK